ncbi:hypothetical protein D9758_008371 [Tetrapyrgos nigripes]|uniref:Uncharacterized protein n=1 Tax=Tetrapyrgos nigripes TaxID=182062 RepID=A0A8H5LN48_9AGAR|nr:hypothetical protein D9758_008371 [Tetrapyrgos nigripes]
MDSLTDPSPANSPQSKKRPRENETPSQRLKREKAAERQRRKRERDRNGGIPPSTSLVYPPDPSHIDIEGLGSPHHHPPAEYMASGTSTDPEMSPEEIIRRDRVRAAARERQRKHRALVKQRKIQQLGMMMGNDVGVAQGEGVHDPDMAYRVPPEAQYLPPELHAHTPPPPQSHLDPQPGEPPFPQHQGHGGQMFATTLLLSFSCAPLLKQHLLSNLQMTNDELASLEPIIANAWDQWDRQRRQYHEQHGGPPPGTHYDPHPPTTSVPVGVAPSATTSSNIPNGSIPTLTYPHPSPSPNPTSNGPSSTGAPPDASTAELRARFQRTLVGPTPFQTQAAAAAAAVAAAQAQAQAQAQAALAHGSQTPTPVPTSVNPANTLKPSSGGSGKNKSSSNAATTNSTSTSSSSSTTGTEIDPHLGQKGDS